MERSRLRAAIGMRYALLNPILDELEKEGRIKMTLGKDGDMVSLTSIGHKILLSNVTLL